MGFLIQIELTDTDNLLGVSMVSESESTDSRVHKIGLAVKEQLVALMPDVLCQACAEAQQPVEKVFEGFAGNNTVN